MRSLFVCHSSHDQAATQRICDQLRSAGFGAIFVDFDAQQGIASGADWEREIHAQLRRADGVLFLASAASVDSRWCFAELCLARSLRRPIFPVRLTPGVQLSLLDGVQWIDMPGGESGFERLRAGLLAAGLDPADSFAWDANRPTYPGLVSFAREDAAVFFGREQETSRLLELLQPMLQGEPGRFVAVVGPSGSGKSSLLHAGLLPRLPDRWIQLPPMRPGTQPIVNLASALAGGFAERGRPRTAEELTGVLRGSPTGLRTLLVELAELANDGRGRPRVLLVIDQAEELLVRSGPTDQRVFLELLEHGLDEDSPGWVVATVRSEHLSSDPERAGLAEAIDDTLIVEPLSRGRLAEVIEGPARRTGLEFDAGLVERMVLDTAGGDALPLLAFTLHDLVARAGRDNRITLAEYEAVGGVIGAMRGRADRLAAELARHGQGELVVPTLLQLAAVDGGPEPTRRRVRRDELSDEQQRVVDAFVDAALLVTHRLDGPGGEQFVFVEVAHEALLRQWAPLREAIEANRVDLRLRSELERLAADWQQGGEDDSYLLRGGRLGIFAHWAEDHARLVSPLARRFLEASQEFASRELAGVRRRNRRLQLLAYGLAVLLLVALGTTGAAVWQTRQANAQSRFAVSRQLAATADQLVAIRPDMAVLVGLESMSLARDIAPQAPAGLVSGLARITHTSRVIQASQRQVFGLAYRPDGKVIATAGSDSLIRMWNAATGQLLGQPLSGHSRSVNGVAFSPDGELLASVSTDRTVRLWNVTSGQARGAPLLGHTESIRSVAFNRDGSLLATGGNDEIVRLWDVATGGLRTQFDTGHTLGLTSVTFSPDGRLLATASSDNTVRLWDAATGQLRGTPLAEHKDAVQSVAFSPDGRLLATGSWDKTVRLWDAATGRPRGDALTGHTGAVSGIAFSVDGKLLASADGAGTVRLWDTGSGRSHGEPLVGPATALISVKISPDGKQIAASGLDGTVRIWTSASRYTISRPLVGHIAPVSSLAYRQDGGLLASAGSGVVRLWDPRTGRQSLPWLNGHRGSVSAVAVSPDGKLLATAGEDNTARLWDLGRRTARGQPLTAHQADVTSVEFSPDGRLLATGGHDSKARLWNAATGEPVGGPLIGHSNGVLDVAFSPDSRLLATVADDQTIRLWDVATGQPHGQPITGHGNRVNAVAFSPDGTLLATGSGDNTARLWDVATGQPHGPVLTAHSDDVHDVAFSPDGTLLATASGDGSARLWDVATGRPHGHPWTGHTARVTGVAFSPDGGTLATSSSDETIRLWTVGFSSWVESGCQLVGRNLTMEEWNQVAPSLPYERTCPNLPAGNDAPADAPAARYRD